MDRYILNRKDFSQNPNRGNILVRLQSDGDYIRIRTYDRIHGGSNCFIMRRTILWDALNGETAIESDISSFVEAFERDDRIHMHIYWISSTGDELSGYRQMFSLPIDLVREVLLSDNRKVKYLYRSVPKPTRFHVARAERTIKNVLKDKRKRRAFVKGMRDHFHWPGDTVTLYSDGSCDLYFTTESGFPANGGLILQESTVRTAQGTCPKLIYSVHT